MVSVSLRGRRKEVIWPELEEISTFRFHRPREATKLTSLVDDLDGVTFEMPGGW